MLVVVLLTATVVVGMTGRVVSGENRTYDSLKSWIADISSEEGSWFREVAEQTLGYEEGEEGEGGKKWEYTKIPLSETETYRDFVPAAIQENLDPASSTSSMDPADHLYLEGHRDADGALHGLVRVFGIRVRDPTDMYMKIYQLVIFSFLL